MSFTGEPTWACTPHPKKNTATQLNAYVRKAFKPKSKSTREAVIWQNLFHTFRRRRYIPHDEKYRTAKDGQCVVGKDEDCKPLDGCKSRGRCTAKDGRCVE